MCWGLSLSFLGMVEVEEEEETRKSSTFLKQAPASHDRAHLTGNGWLLCDDRQDLALPASEVTTLHPYRGAGTCLRHQTWPKAFVLVYRTTRRNCYCISTRSCGLQVVFNPQWNVDSNLFLFFTHLLLSIDPSQLASMIKISRYHTEPFTPLRACNGY
jgi:hypothetical protein